LVADATAIRGLVSSRRMPLTFGGAARVLPATPAISRYPRSHAALPTRVARRPGVRRARDVVYACPDGTPLKLDICTPALPSPRPLPAIVQVHGGGFVTGSRREALPLVTHLAANGWATFSIDYRLSPRATFPDHLVDVKRAIAWVRENADAYGVDPSFVAVTGGSAGATLAALAALTANDETLQPGFEDADTSVAAVEEVERFLPAILETPAAAGVRSDS